MKRGAVEFGLAQVHGVEFREFGLGFSGWYVGMDGMDGLDWIGLRGWDLDRDWIYLGSERVANSDEIQ